MKKILCFLLLAGLMSIGCAKKPAPGKIDRSKYAANPTMPEAKMSQQSLVTTFSDLQSGDSGWLHRNRVIADAKRRVFIETHARVYPKAPSDWGDKAMRIECQLDGKVVLYMRGDEPTWELASVLPPGNWCPVGEVVVGEQRNSKDEAIKKWIDEATKKELADTKRQLEAARAEASYFRQSILWREIAISSAARWASISQSEYVPAFQAVSLFVPTTVRISPINPVGTDSLTLTQSERQELLRQLERDFLK